MIIQNIFSTKFLFLFFAISLIFLLFVGLNWTPDKEYIVTQLPYDNTHPVIYDNDEAIDVYTDDYLMALASVGEVNLVGMITSSTIKPHNRWVTAADYDRMVEERLENVIHARNSGFKNIPDPVLGPKGHLQKPVSGKIEDTQPIGTQGSWLIVREARKTTPEKPLVLVMGGSLTTAADAYLLDNSIADKVVVAWLGGTISDMGVERYNGWADGWADYIVLEKLKLIQFPEAEFAPSVPKSRLTELPESDLRQFMVDKYLHNGLPDEHDYDAPPAIPLIRKDYVVKAKRVSFSHWQTYDEHEIPVFKNDPNGTALVVIQADVNVATEEWWRALSNPAAYHLAVEND